jgi:hypothetical protein
MKEWSDALRTDDTEMRSLQRAMSAIGEYGTWRIVKSSSNEGGKTMEVSKKKKTVTMRYTVDGQTEIKETEIGVEDTVRGIMARMDIKEHVVIDSKGSRFLEQDHLFTYFTGENPVPLKIEKAQRTVQPRPRQIERARDEREGIQIHFGDKMWAGKKSDGANYRLIFERAQRELKIEGWWKVAHVRQDGPRIIVEAERKPDDQPPSNEDWKDAVTWPALGTVGDALRRMVRKSETSLVVRRPNPAKMRIPIDVKVDYLRQQTPDIKSGTKAARVVLEVEGEETREEIVGENASTVEIAHAEFRGKEWPTHCTIMLENAPTILTDGTRIKITKKEIPGKVETGSVYQTRDNRRLSVGLQVDRREEMKSFWPRLQKALKEDIEPVEEYQAWRGGDPAGPPWEEGKRYE